MKIKDSMQQRIVFFCQTLQLYPLLVEILIVYKYLNKKFIQTFILFPLLLSL